MCDFLAGAPDVERLVVADLSGGRAREVVAELGDHCVARAIDVTDHADLVAAIRDCDIVVNTVGPYFRFGPGVLRAAIEAERDYVDVCDDPVPTMAMLEMNADAESAGITAVLGVGARPRGGDNLCARGIGADDRGAPGVAGGNQAKAPVMMH
ncbi:saccharopine dehydrogenase NADP-binding domain-containing protein [Nocardia cyriacigeorgica]|uniref:saccharopine dehydrogenase NADP-binding domain-containing protein n=1 Tax=Nocardia cyriacigeorgica TaxID=135487 RepID=UPI0024552D1E|nr:saccharopine dehydrogenase NADP-binding domain-containing protein [Nocardia cyriacigeorgica]